MTENQSLESVLQEVEDLAAGLSTKIVLEPEQGEWVKDVDDPGSGPERYYNAVILDREATPRWVVNKPEVSKPDEKKRATARARLQQIYDFSEWYSARYFAGGHLDLDDSVLRVQLENWMEDLKKGNTAVLPPFYEDAPKPDYSTECDFCSRMGNSSISPSYDRHVGCPDCLALAEEAMRDIEEWEANGGKRLVKDAPDLGKRKKSEEDLRALYRICRFDEQRRGIGNILHIPEPDILADELFRGVSLTPEELLTIYNKASEERERYMAGRALGHSKLRIWAHEHPIAAPFTGIAAGSAAYGFACGLIKYLEK